MSFNPNATILGGRLVDTDEFLDYWKNNRPRYSHLSRAGRRLMRERKPPRWEAPKPRAVFRALDRAGAFPF